MQELHGESMSSPWDTVEVEAIVKIIEMTGSCEKVLKNFEFDNMSTDLAISVEGRDFFVHEQVLATHTSYFKDRHVTLQNISAADFQNLLEVIYGESDVEDHTAHAILYLAHKLEMKLIVQKCVDFLLQISESTIHAVIHLACRLQIHRLHQKCANFLSEKSENFNDELTNYQLENLVNNCIEKIDSIDNIKAKLAAGWKDSILLADLLVISLEIY